MSSACARACRFPRSTSAWAWPLAAGSAAVGSATAIDYLTGFVIEKSLAMDNIFVIAMIFTAFAIPRALQHRVLFWGVLGVVVLRAAMIGMGVGREFRLDALSVRGFPDLDRHRHVAVRREGL